MVCFYYNFSNWYTRDKQKPMPDNCPRAHHLMNIITAFFGVRPVINCYNISLLGSSKLHPCSAAAIFASGNHKTRTQALVKTASSHLKATLASLREAREVKDSTVSQL